MNRRGRSLSFITAIAVAFTVLGAVPATACLVPPPQKPDVWIEFHSPTDVWITFHGYKTFGSDESKFCACGLSPLGAGVITSVTGVAIVEAGTDTPVGGFGFAASAAVSAALNAQLGTGNWTGFLSDMSATVNADVDVDLRIEVTVDSGATPGDVVDALGAGAALGTDEASAAGALLLTHLSIFEGPFPPAPIPTVTEWGIATMALLVLATGTIVIRRYSLRKRLA